MILFSCLPFSALSLCHAGLVSFRKRSYLCWLSVGKSSHSSQWQPPSPLSQFRGDLWWGWQGLPATRLGWVLLGCGRHSSVTACEHESHLLIFSSAPLFSYSQLRKGGENAFGHWPIYCYITYSITSFQYDRSQSSAALKMPLKFFVNALTEVTNFKKKHEKRAQQFKIWVSYFIVFVLGR